MAAEKVSLSLPSEMLETLRKKAAKEARTLSMVVRLFIEAGLKKSK